MIDQKARGEIRTEHIMQADEYRKLVGRIKTEVIKQKASEIAFGFSLGVIVMYALVQVLGV